MHFITDDPTYISHTKMDFNAAEGEFHEMFFESDILGKFSLGNDVIGF